MSATQITALELGERLPCGACNQRDRLLPCGCGQRCYRCDVVRTASVNRQNGERLLRLFAQALGGWAPNINREVGGAARLDSHNRRTRP